MIQKYKNLIYYLYNLYIENDDLSLAETDGICVSDTDNDGLIDIEELPAGWVDNCDDPMGEWTCATNDTDECGECGGNCNGETGVECGNYNCAGDCVAETGFDCEGVCGGGAVLDVCGICWPLELINFGERVGYSTYKAQGKDLVLLLRKPTMEKYDFLDIKTQTSHLFPKLVFEDVALL